MFSRFMHMFHAVRYAMEDIEQLASFQNIEKAAYFNIRVGEFRDNEKSESVFQRSVQLRSSVSCRGWLEIRLEFGYIYEYVADVDVSGGSYSGINLSYACLEKVALNESDLSNSLLWESVQKAARVIA